VVQTCAAAAMLVVLHVEGAGLETTCPIYVSSVVPGQKLLTVSWLVGDLIEELLVVQYPCGAMTTASVG
jgi:hypothetical protein